MSLKASGACAGYTVPLAPHLPPVLPLRPPGCVPQEVAQVSGSGLRTEGGDWAGEPGFP